MTAPLPIWLPDPLRWNDARCAEILQACPQAVLCPESRGQVVDVDSINGRDIHVLVSELLPRNLVEWQKLRFVQVCAAGIDYLKGHPIWDTRIPVATVRGVHSVPIAEHVTGMLLQMSHRMPDTARFGDSWSWPDRPALAGEVLRGMTAGIVGYGCIGAECGRQLQALGMRVLACKQHPDRKGHAPSICWPGSGDPEGRIPERFFGPHELRSMLPHCRALVISAAKTDSTIGLIGSTELALLPPRAWVVVASRGGIIDEPALAAALRNGTIAGAAVDAYVVEPPLPDHPLRGAPRLIATPHMSGVYTENWMNICRVLCENLRRMTTGKPLLNLVDAP